MRKSKKHLYAVYQVLHDLSLSDTVTSHAFICVSKEDAVQCRNNVTSHTMNTFKDMFTTEICASVNMQGDVNWFLIVKKEQK